MFGPAKHEALGASTRVALQQRESSVSAAVAVTSFHVHLAGALSPLVALADAVVLAGTGVGARRVAVAALAVGEAVVAGAAVVAVLPLEALQALALARVLVTVGTQRAQLVALAQLAAINGVVAPGPRVAAITPGTTRVLGADAAAGLLVAHMARSFTRLAGPAAMVGETVVTRQADVAGHAADTGLAVAFSRSLVTLGAHGACGVAAAGFTASWRRQVPVTRLALATGAAHNVGLAWTLAIIFITLGAQGSVGVTTTPFAAVWKYGESIVSLEAGVTQGAKDSRSTDAVARDRVAPLGDRAPEIAPAWCTTTLHSSEAILTPVAGSPREAGLAGTLACGLVAHLAGRARHTAVTRPAVSRGWIPVVPVQALEAVPAACVATATQTPARAVVAVARHRGVGIGPTATRTTGFARNGRVAKEAVGTSFTLVSRVVWRALQANVVALAGRGHNCSALGGEVIRT